MANRKPSQLDTREFDFRIRVRVASEAAAVRLEDDWRLQMSLATQEWAKRQGFTESDIARAP